MEFSYSVYYRQNALIPLILSLFCVGMIIYWIVKFIISWHRGLLKFDSTGRKFLFLFAVFAFLLIVNLVYLFRGGIYLFTEKENDGIYVEGVIEETMEAGWLAGNKYDVEQNNGLGEIIILNGDKYYIMTYGNFKKGDYVCAKVLPKSKFVLEIFPKKPE